jgi:hypothetical protein
MHQICGIFSSGFISTSVLTSNLNFIYIVKQPDDLYSFKLFYSTSGKEINIRRVFEYRILRTAQGHNREEVA